MFENIRIRRIVEGSTPYWIPDPEYYGKPGRYIPMDLPIFYNPNMEINRDLSLLAIQVYSELYDIPLHEIYYIEALAGTGIRGFRAINELGPINVILNDINPLCCRFMQFNSRFFPPQARSHVTMLNHDASYLLCQIKYWIRPMDIVDIDPFGTPAPYIDPAMRALKRKHGMLLVTATDTAALIGKFEKSCLRKYGSWLSPTLFSGEIGVRALVYYIFKISTKYGVGLKPIFGMFFGGFIKAGFISIPGRKNADRLWRRVGWISVRDQNVDIVDLHSPKPPGSKILGPLWIGELFDANYMNEAIKLLPNLPISPNSKKKLERIFRSEVNVYWIPFYYNLEYIASSLRIPTPKTDAIVMMLREDGYIAERTHFDSKAIKTNAPIDAVIKVMGEITDRRRDNRAQTARR